MRYRIHTGDTPSAGHAGSDGFCEGAVIRVVWAIGVSLIFVVVALVYVRLAPEKHLHDNFLLRDAGSALTVAGELLDGKQLYQEVFWWYGPVPILFYAGVAAFFGNSASTYVDAQIFVFGVGLGVLFLGASRYAKPWEAGIATIIVAIPYILLFQGAGILYRPFEMLGVSALCCFYGSPIFRTLTQAIAIGLILGFLQWCKFGTAVLAGVAIVVIDLLNGFRGFRAESMRHWIGRYLIVLVVFLIAECIRAATLLVALEREVALDVIWPAYMISAYGAYVKSGLHFEFEGWVFLLSVQIPMIFMLLVSLAGFLYMKFRQGSGGLGESRLDAIAAAGVPGVMFPVGLLYFFRHAFLVYHYQWLLIISLVLNFIGFARLGRVCVVLGVVPAVLALGYHCVRENATGRWFDLPSGESLFVAESRMEEVQEVDVVLRGSLGRIETLAVFGFPGGRSYSGGMHHHYGIGSPSRHTLFLHGLMRPFEEEEVFRSLRETDVLLVFVDEATASSVGPDPTTWDVQRWSPFTTVSPNELAALFDPPQRVGRAALLFRPKKGFADGDP